MPVDCRRAGCILAAAAAALLGGRAGAGGGDGPLEIVARAEQRFAALRDYECVVETEARKGSRTDAVTLRLWFRKPHLIRVRVLRGRNRGSEAAVQASGRVRARKGGILKAFVMTLKPDDPKLRSIRGVPLTALDWGSFYAGFRERAALPGAVTRSLAPGSGGEPGGVEVSYSRDGHRLREVYRIDPALRVLSEASVFEEGIRVDHARFSEIRLDTGVQESWFRL